MTLRGRSAQFYAFRNVAAMYYAVILCISNSPFTIKTAALLWFLLGVLAHEPERRGALRPLKLRAPGNLPATATAGWRARRIPPPRMRA
jgi:putative polymerase